MKTFYEAYVEFTHLPELPNNGLCNSIPNNLKRKLAWKLIYPTIKDILILEDEGKSSIYWGSGLSSKDPNVGSGFTELRQTILLLAACINKEEF